MRKKYYLALIVCLVLSILAGCDSKIQKPFGMKIEDLNIKINENIKVLGYDVTVPEFILFENNNSKIYHCNVNNDLNVSISNNSMNNSYQVDILLVFPSQTASIEIADNIKNYIAVSSAVIATIDPKADINKIIDSLKLDSTSDSTEITKLTCRVNGYVYESNTSISNKTFNVK